MYRKLNDRRKHKTIYPEREQYSDKSYRLGLLLKLRTLSPETHLFGNSFQTDNETITKKKLCKRYF